MWVLKRMKIGLYQWTNKRLLSGRVHQVRLTYLRMAELSLPAVITVVVNGLISSQDEKVILTGKYLNGVDNKTQEVLCQQLSVVSTVHFSYCLKTRYIFC